MTDLGTRNDKLENMDLSSSVRSEKSGHVRTGCKGTSHPESSVSSSIETGNIPHTTPSRSARAYLNHPKRRMENDGCHTRIEKKDDTPLYLKI